MSSSSPKSRKDARSIELTPLSSEDEFESKSVETIESYSSKPSLFKALCRTYMGRFLVAGFFKLIADLLNFVGPLLLK